MWMAVNRGRRYKSFKATAAFLVVLSLVGLGNSMLLPATGEERRLDFLNESMRAPESIRFRESDYINSGVGLRFGVDRRLSYYAGQYEEAAKQFEKSVQAFRYKSEIWVFLARAYYLMNDPEKARKTLQRAAMIMPDLNENLWSPLLQGLLWEIRQRALALQTQIDFYSKEQGDFVKLLRLYCFLEDYPAASTVINTADARANKMNELAGMASAVSRPQFVAQSKIWQQLADEMRTELKVLGHDAPSSIPLGNRSPEMTSVDSELEEKTRQLQLRIDFYQATQDEYIRLFDNYLALNKPLRAKTVIEALDREIIRVRFRAESVPDFLEQAELEEQIVVLQELQRSMRMQLSEGVEQTN